MHSVETPDRERKREKVRSAWISFAGRITAQIIGSVATVTLGVVVLGKGQPVAKAADVAHEAKSTVLLATPVRTHGETVIVMLPLGKDGKTDGKMAIDVAESYEKTKTNPVRVSARRQTPTDPNVLLSGDPSDDTHETLGSPHE
jgi:hypothetical protein